MVATDLSGLTRPSPIICRNSQTSPNLDGTFPMWKSPMTGAIQEISSLVLLL
jgi:hypothetical protein